MALVYLTLIPTQSLLLLRIYGQIKVGVLYLLMQEQSKVHILYNYCGTFAGFGRKSDVNYSSWPQIKSAVFLYGNEGNTAQVVYMP